MLHPILFSTAKVSSKLQTEKLELLTAVDLITGLKNILSEFRSYDHDFDVIYDATLKYCAEFNIEIPEVKKQKISSRVDPNKETQHFIESKKEEMKYSCYFVTLDEMLSGLNSRFSQETLSIISAVGNLINLTTSENEYVCLSNTFDINIDNLKNEIKLLKNFSNTEMPKGTSTVTITQWLQWLNHSDRADIFINFNKALQLFITIPVTSCSCERAFSKLNIVKSKLRASMNQERLDSLLFMSIEQEVCTKIDYGEIIEEFKTLVPGNRRLVL